jgi:hypothetical protein
LNVVNGGRPRGLGKRQGLGSAALLLSSWSTDGIGVQRGGWSGGGFRRRWDGIGLVGSRQRGSFTAWWVASVSGAATRRDCPPWAGGVPAGATGSLRVAGVLRRRRRCCHGQLPSVGWSHHHASTSQDQHGLSQGSRLLLAALHPQESTNHSGT